MPLRRPPLRFFESKPFLTLLLVGAFLWSLTAVNWGGPLLHTGGLGAIRRFFLALFPPDLSPDFLLLGLEASWQTVAYAMTGMTVAVALGFPLGVLASGVILRPQSRWRGLLVAATRFVLAGLRAVHELVWAVLFVAAFGLSSLTAILALALPYAGILGRIYAEQLQDAPLEPLRALRASGASPWQVWLYGYLPLALPDMTSYTFYRFECAIRAAAVMSFVGIQGLGYQIQLSLNDLLFRQVWTLLLFLLALVLLVDFWGRQARRSMAA